MRRYLTIFAILLTIAASAQGGYAGKRFVFSYSPAYSCIFQGASLSPYPVHHHKVELGMSLGNHVQINVNAEKSMHFKSVDMTKINDRTLGLNILFYKSWKGAYAPIGSYIGVGYNIGKQLIADNTLWATNLEPNETTFYEERKMQLLSFYFGQNYIVYERLFLGYGIQWGIPTDGYANSMRHLMKPFFKIGIAF